MSEKEELAIKINDLTGWDIKPNRLKIITDTTQWMSIIRGDIIRIGAKDFLVKGNLCETRFGIEEQPKYWVFNTIDMESGKTQILKMVFHEEFTAHIGILKIRCYRSPEKEADVLNLVRGDLRFMQGKVYHDEMNNTIRALDFIKGNTIFNEIYLINKPHEQFFHEDLPEILRKLYDSFLAIQLLHKNKLCHGDIRNDHIFIERETGAYKWIDFDLKQDVSDFDMWSMGNIISYTAGKGIRTFSQILKGNEFSEEVKNSLELSDSSAFHNYRIMNLSKLYPYIPPKLSDMLRHFTINPPAFYSGIDEFCDRYWDMLETEFPSLTNK
ncbi:MAG: hypothetical protein EPN82_13880 [Bacteroidetes bacterium]|nr:MAG: hypothetical protein EPN82_13880 [Bacteroidota bacterium]